MRRASVLADRADYVYLSQGAQDGIKVGKHTPSRASDEDADRIRLADPTHERDLGTHYLDVAQLRVVMLQPEFSLGSRYP